MGEFGLNVVKDRDTWQSFVNTVMNVDAPDHAENFLIG
jgi:hypothetical protein